MTDPLAKLFGTPARLKLLRLFLFNPRQSFTVADAAARARLKQAEARREIALLSQTGLIARTARGQGVRWMLNGDFSHTTALQNLLLNAPARGEELAGRIRGTGALKLVVLSGIFMNEWDSGLDALIVGDRIRERSLRERMKTLESEVGRELRYALLSSDDFRYRLGMNDRLLRDILDYPHRTVLNKLPIALK